MIYCFEDFELDKAKLELRQNGADVPIEPQVFALLALLIDERARVVAKDEIVEKIWNGRIISDSAIASRIKSARQALGDDGASQRLIRTMHGVGFRFVGEVETSDKTVFAHVKTFEAPIIAEPPLIEAARPSIAVLPFRVVGDPGPYTAMADALPADLITELARLRWLFVISRASSFQFRGPDISPGQVRIALNVRYCLSGVIDILGQSLTVSVELSDTQDGGIVWGDRFRAEPGAVHEIREEIVRAIINALELQIPLNEARRARLKPVDQLDAWAAYHLGLQHMYRFNKTDNALAANFFERAATLDPDFARAYAGLSFTHFQDGFLYYSGDRERSAQLAQRFAEKAMERDPLDPFGVAAMGRAQWLHGDLETGLGWLDRANLLNPNSAQSKYAHGVLDALVGSYASSQSQIDAALALSPLDPLVYAMLATRAFAHTVQGDHAEAARWGERAARSPGAHAWIEMIAAVMHTLNGDEARAQAWVASARERVPTINKGEFLRTFPFRDPDVAKRIGAALTKLGV